MKLRTSITLYALFTSVFFAAIPVNATAPDIGTTKNTTPFYQRAIGHVIQKTKNGLHRCKKKFAALKAQITERKPPSDTQLLMRFLLGFALLYSAMIASLICINHVKLPYAYTEDDLEWALYSKDHATINDYLDNKRVGPNDLCRGLRMLHHAAINKDLNTVQKLLDMGANHRLLNGKIDTTVSIENAFIAAEEKLQARGREAESYYEMEPLITQDQLPLEMYEKIRTYCAGPPYDTSTIPAHLREFSKEIKSGKMEDID